MTLQFTPDTLRASYEFLRTTPPFVRWKLPHADQIDFGLIRDGTTCGDYTNLQNGRHRIRLSDKHIGHTYGLLTVMAHEMVHLRQDLMSGKGNHGALFRRLAKVVCKHHGFDPKAF